MAFNHERTIAVDEEQKTGADNVVVVNEGDLPAGALRVGDIRWGGIKVAMAVQRISHHSVKFDYVRREIIF